MKLYIGRGTGSSSVVDKAVSLAFHQTSGEIASQHYALLIHESDFDAIFTRIHDHGLAYWADPEKHRAGEINHNDCARGKYFEDPDGHLLEIVRGPAQ